MIVRRVARFIPIMLPILVWMACGQVYRPVVIPCSTGGVPGCPVQSNPKPGNFHTVFAVSMNSANNPGGAMQIDVSGDSVIGETPTNDPAKPNLGNIPTHAAVAINKARVFVASAGSLLAGGVDVVSYFTPVFQTTSGGGLSAVGTISLPSGSLPVFLNSTQNNLMYVANYGTNSVAELNTVSNVIANTATVGTQPVSLAETPNGLKLYVANQGSNTVSSLNTVDLSANTVTGFTGVTPVWAVARGDSQKVYVLTQGDGQLITIDTGTDNVTSSIAVGSGANFLYLDPNLNRLYVVNPATATVYVFSDTGPSDTPTQLAAISMNSVGASAPCPNGCIPTSVTALADGSRFYVASYRSPASCPDSNVSGACIIPGLTVFDANSFAVKYPSAPTATLLNSVSNEFAAGQYAVAPVTSCAPPAVYAPGTTRFRMFTVASADSTRVYVSMCDAGAIAVINTTDSNTNNTGNPVPPDSLVTDLLAATGATGLQANGSPSLQNPFFLLDGQ